MKTVKEAFKIYKGVFDQFTLQVLEKLRRQGHYDEMVSPLKVGKESNVFLASKQEAQVILKIYRIENADFKKMYSYLVHDARYVNLKSQNRRVIFTWAKREFRNLHIARDSGVSVPTPYAVLHNVLVEECIGSPIVAQRLKDDSPLQKKRFFHETLLNMKKLHAGGLVHGDLSEFNILNYNDKPVFIDFSQATLLKSSSAEELLKRDIKNILRYFTKIGVNTSEQEIRRAIE